MKYNTPQDRFMSAISRVPRTLVRRLLVNAWSSRYSLTLTRPVGRSLEASLIAACGKLRIHLTFSLVLLFRLKLLRWTVVGESVDINHAESSWNKRKWSNILHKRESVRSLFLHADLIFCAYEKNRIDSDTLCRRVTWHITRRSMFELCIYTPILKSISRALQLCEQISILSWLFFIYD